MERGSGNREATEVGTQMLRGGCLALMGWLFATLPAFAGTVAFEDHGLVESGHWQLNSIFCVLPNLQRIEGVSVSALAPEEASYVGQFSQEFRYGLSDRLMIRTTVPVSVLQDGTGTMSGGLGDWEVFVKTALFSDEASPFSASAGLQVIMPTGLPETFSLNGSVNLVPSLMLGAEAGPGELVATLGYGRALGVEREGHFIHPSDSLFYALGYSVELGERCCASLECLGSETLLSQVDDLFDPQSASRQLTLGPALTWALDPSTALLVGVQAAVWRQGMVAQSQPLYGFAQYSRTL